jgi:[acyl-carrier-protein] S-malonyltransferase
MTALAFVFPGQGSQALGMLAAWAEEPIVRDLYARASTRLGRDLWRLAQEGPAEELNRTEWTQPVLLAAGVALWQVWCARGGRRPALLAGHSLGEYSALVASEALEFEAAVELVAARGRAMQAAVAEGQGAMAAVLQADLATIEAACAEASQGEVVAPANLNAPGQIVISGQAAAVERTLALLAARGVKRAIRLPVSVPSHCALMRPAAAALAPRLAAAELRRPSIPVLHNVDASPRTDPEAIRSALIEQLYAPVRWIETIEAIAAQGVGRVLECGPGKVLCGLVKRIAPALDVRSLAEPTDLEQALEAVR